MIFQINDSKVTEYDYNKSCFKVTILLFISMITLINIICNLYGLIPNSQDLNVLNNN